jgi:ribosomal subunit interface protein
MKIQITARHFKAKESTQDYIKTKVEELNKYNENIIFADVILSYDKPPADTKYCEIILKLKEKTLTTKESSGDFERAIDIALNKIEKQLYKVKDKQKTSKKAKLKL